MKANKILAVIVLILTTIDLTLTIEKAIKEEH